MIQFSTPSFPPPVFPHCFKNCKGDEKKYFVVIIIIKEDDDDYGTLISIFLVFLLQYLDAQIQKYMSKVEKTEAEAEREQSLVDQWVCLTEERNSVMVPAPNSGVPGAPADWEPPDGTEAHSPVLFLDLNADDLSTGYAESEEVIMFGSNSILPKEGI